MLQKRSIISGNGRHLSSWSLIFCGPRVGPWLPVPWSGLQAARDTQLNPHRLRTERACDIHLKPRATLAYREVASAAACSCVTRTGSLLSRLGAARRSVATWASAWDTRSPGRRGHAFSLALAGSHARSRTNQSLFPENTELLLAGTGPQPPRMPHGEFTPFKSHAWPEAPESARGWRAVAVGRAPGGAARRQLQCDGGGPGGSSPSRPARPRVPAPPPPAQARRCPVLWWPEPWIPQRPPTGPALIGRNGTERACHEWPVRPRRRSGRQMGVQRGLRARRRRGIREPSQRLQVGRPAPLEAGLPVPRDRPFPG